MRELELQLLEEGILITNLHQCDFRLTFDPFSTIFD